MNVAAVNISVQLFVWIYMFWVFLVLIIYLFLAALGLCCSTWVLCCCVQTSSSCDEQGLETISSCQAQASHCGGFSCCRTEVLGLPGFRSRGTRT